MLIQVAAPAAIAVAVVSLVVAIFRKAILAEIKTSIEHDYNLELESFKATMQKENSESLLRFQNELEHRDTLRAYVRSSVAESQRRAGERRLDALQDLWNSLLSLNEDIPPIVRYFDNWTADEYAEAKGRSKGQKLLSDFSYAELETLSAKHGQVSGGADRTASEINYDVERVRPLVGEYIWALFSDYRLLVFRLLFLLHRLAEGHGHGVWYKDDYARGVLSRILNAKEMEELDGLRLRKFQRLQELVDFKLLLGIQKIVSGEASGEEAIEQDQLIAERVAERPGSSWLE